MDGATIGQYRVTGMIGRGGMGAVYAGEHTLLGRPAAIKVLLPDLSQKQEVVQRFFNEARAATAIRHPGIVEVYDFGWTPGGAAFIVMEFLDGETLARRSARARFRWPAALAIARQIAGALSAAHAKGIVHRDLKPDNVFLVPDPEVPGGERIKLLDFGIAKLAIDTTGTSNVTKTGAVMGTPTYMAPEQCRGVAVDHRADLYSLGCVIYELCCGRPPFVGEGSGDVLAAHIHLPVPPMQGTVGDLSPAVEQLVRRMLAKPPADRVQSADEVIRAIDAVAPDRIAAATGPRRATPVATSPSVTTLSGSASTSMLMPRAGRRGRWPLAAFSVGMAALSALIVVLVMRGGDHGGAAPPATEAPAAPPLAAPPAKTVARNPSSTPPAAATSAAPSAAAPSPAPSAAAPSPAPSAATATSAPDGAAPSSAPSAAAATPTPSAAAIKSAPSTAAVKPAPSAAAATPAPSAAATTPAPSAAAPKPAPSMSPTASGERPAVSDRTPAPAVHTDRPPSPVARATSPADRATLPDPFARSRPPAAAPQPAERPTIDVAVDSVPGGAQVMLDGALVGTTPYRGTLRRGGRDVKLVLRLSGYADKTVTVHASQPISERVKLVRATGNRDQSVNPF